jgi:hypothetical protein
MFPLAHAGSWAWLEMALLLAPFCALLLLEEPTDSPLPSITISYCLSHPIALSGVPRPFFHLLEGPC